MMVSVAGTMVASHGCRGLFSNAISFRQTWRSLSYMHACGLAISQSTEVTIKKNAVVIT